MSDIVPHINIPDEKSEGEGKRGVARGILLIVAAVVAVILLLWGVNVRRDRQQAAVQAQTARSGSDSPAVSRQGSPLVQFTPGDVTVSHRWSLFAGTHPAVTFRCRLSPTLPKTEYVMLRYRTLASDTWHSVEAKPRRGGEYRITLRDLHRDMHYECFFLAYGKDTVTLSDFVTFSTTEER